MIEKQRLLIASTNQGKIIEIRHALETLPFDIVTLDDLSSKIGDMEETAETIEENALQKARHYAQAATMLTLADDTGLFLDARAQWPGVRTRRVADTDDGRRQAVLRVAEEAGNKAAAFKSAVALYNPVSDEAYIAIGETRGELVTSEVGEHLPHLPYDSIFYIPEKKKTYAQLSIAEKNSLSHRGKALTKMKYIIHNLFRPKHVVVPVALIIKDGKLLMNRRNDPYNPAVHNTWEFPGGSVEYGESIEENIIRETREEVGFDIELISMLRKVSVDTQEKPGGIRYQVYLIPFVCRIIGGKGVVRDEEVLETRWFDLDDVLKQDLIAKNDEMYRALLPELQKIISRHNL